jgi:hypothetical protein
MLRNNKNNTSGFVTADFIFSFLLASMMTTLLFGLCFTFTVIEIAQYISFSATRAAIPAQKSYAQQKDRAEKKYAQLVSNSVIRPLLINGWFSLSLAPQDIRLNEKANEDFSEEYSGEKDPLLIMPAAGVRLTLTAKILNLNLGPLGRIESETGNGFNLKIGTLLFREPTQEECQKLIESRYSRILDLNKTQYRVLGEVGLGGSNPYFPMEDNGC